MKKAKEWLKGDLFWILLVLAASVLAILPFFRAGFYTFSDEPHIANLYEMTRGFAAGQFPPRWAPDMSFNYGYPLFNFYYPLPFYLGALFHFICKTSLIWSLKLVFLLSVPLSGIVFYFLLRKFFRQQASFSGAILYMFTPYRAVDLYVRGAVGEMWAFVLIPLVFLAFWNLMEKARKQNLVFAALSLAGLILAHNLTAIIIVPILITFCLVFSCLKDKPLRSMIWSIGGVLGGLSISAFYWLPAILEKKYIQSGTPFNPFDHFPFIKQLILPSWGYGASVWGPNDQMSFQVGVVNLLVLVLSIAFIFIARKKMNKEKIFLGIFILVLFGGSLFLMNIRSWFIWKAFPLGSYIQFPWRLLMLTTFSTAFLTGYLETLKNKTAARTLLVLVPFLAILLTFNYFRPAKIMEVNDDYYLNRFFINRLSAGERSDLSRDYLNYSEDYLPLTIWTKKRPDSLPKEKIAIEPGVINYQAISPIKYLAEAKTSEPARVYFHNYYFPGWVATIGGRPAQIDINDPHGNMVVEVPAGTHQVLFVFAETPIRKAGNWLSLLSIIVCGLLCLRVNFSTRRVKTMVK